MLLLYSMPQSLSHLIVHAVFSTKDRQPFLLLPICSARSKALPLAPLLWQGSVQNPSRADGEHHKGINAVVKIHLQRLRGERSRTRSSIQAIIDRHNLSTAI